MAEVIRMPKMSDTMEEGVIASWQKKVGDKVESGDILAEVETDKATMELESFEDGTLLYIGVQENEAVAVDGVIAIIGEEGENIDDLLGQMKSSNGKSEAADTPAEQAPAEAEAAEDIDTSSISASLVTMPKMSDTMTEGVIASWQKKVGDKVESGDILAEVETDKATMELEAYEDGTLLYIGVEDGGSVEIDGVIAVIGEEGADYEKLLQAHNAKKQGGDQQDEAPVAQDSVTAEDKSKETAGHKGAAEVTPTHAETPAASATNTEGGRVKASPLAKKMAKEMGYDISQIPGTGENGRVVRRDVENYKPAPKPAAEQPAAARQDTARQPAPVSLPEVVGEEQYEEVRVSQMRKTIARRLSESKFTAPHFYLTMEINMDNAIRARKSMNELSPVKISFNDIVLKAAAAALRLHPQVNVSWLGDKMRYNKYIHIGVAVAVEEGLLVPVVRFADNKTISHISAEVKDLATKAKNKQLQPQDWEGSTFTISNLGMFGIEEFTAIVNPPDACIMAVGGIKETPVVKDGQIVPGNVMKVTMSCDHRAVDGAIGAAFLKTFKQFMEDPIRILI